MSVRYDQVEQDILARLQVIADANSQISIQLAPENEDDYERTSHQPAIWVLVEEEQADARIEAGLMTQTTTLTIVITLQAMKLRGTSGVRYLEQLIKQRLLGFRPSNFEKLQFVGSRHEFNDNIWSMYCGFQAQGLVQETEDDIPLVLLKQITYETDENPQFAVVPEPGIPMEVPDGL